MKQNESNSIGFFQRVCSASSWEKLKIRSVVRAVCVLYNLSHCLAALGISRWIEKSKQPELIYLMTSSTNSLHILEFFAMLRHYSYRRSKCIGAPPSSQLRHLRNFTFLSISLNHTLYNRGRQEKAANVELLRCALRSISFQFPSLQEEKREWK